MSKILFFGELPPKVVHGISISNQRILKILSSEHTIEVVEDNSSFGGIAKKLLSLFRSYALILLAAFKKNSVVYVNAPMSRFGLLKIETVISTVQLINPKAKVVAHLHRGDAIAFLNSPANYTQFFRFCNRLHTLIVLAEKSKLELIERNVIASSKLAVLYNSVTPLLVQSSASELGSYKGTLYCLCNYIESKRIHNLVDSTQRLNTKVNFSGTPSSSEYLEKLKSIDIAKLCQFGATIHGVDKEERLREAKALVLPSLNEGMPLVILESLAQGTPVICFNIGYISDYLGEDYPGLVTNLTDSSLEDKMNWIEQLTESEYSALRQLSFDLFWDNFSPKKIQKETTQLFNVIDK